MEKAKHYSIITGGITFNEFLPISSIRCDECLVHFQEEQLIKCPMCELVRYCGEKCQILAWRSSHGMMCNKVKISAIEGRGFGVIAMKDIKKGELIFTEKPLLRLIDDNCAEAVTYNKGVLNGLSAKCRRRIMSLSDGIVSGRGTLAEKLAVNTFTLGDGGFHELFYHISRINHSCYHNISVNDKHHLTNVSALRDIKQGEELLWNYIKFN